MYDDEFAIKEKNCKLVKDKMKPQHVYFGFYWIWI